MKISVFLFTVLFSQISFAANWQVVLKCDNGAMVVDEDRANPRSPIYQIVIRDRGIVSYFSGQGVGRKNSSGEIIYSNLKYDGLKGEFAVVDTNVNVRLKLNGQKARLDVVTRNGRIANWIFNNCSIRYR